MPDHDALLRLLSAEERIVNREPWFKGVAASTRWIEWPLGAPMGADGGDVYYDPVLVRAFDGYIEGFVLHEYLHNLCDHIARRDNRETGLWNVACDYAINPFVTKLFDLPPGLCLLDAKYAGMSPEAIYDALGGKRGTLGATLTMALAEMPPDLSGEPLERARQKWRDVIQTAGEPPAFLNAAIEEIAGR
jgi:hypothetical protein